MFSHEQLHTPHSEMPKNTASLNPPELSYFMGQPDTENDHRFNKEGNARQKAFEQNLGTQIDQTRKLFGAYFGANFGKKPNNGNISVSLGKSIPSKSNGNIEGKYTNSNAIEEMKTLATNSSSFADFIANIKNRYQQLDDEQKINAIAALGHSIAQLTFNHSNIDVPGDISDEKQFFTLKEAIQTGNRIDTGVCRHIGGMLSNIAKSLNLKSEMMGTQGHILSVIKRNDGKVSVLDYGNIYTFSPQDYSHFRQQYLKENGGTGYFGKMFNSQTGETTGITRTPLEDVSRFSQAGIHGVQSIATDFSTGWNNAGTNVSVNIQGEKQFNAHLGYGTQTEYAYIEKASIRDAINSDGQVSYGALGIKTQREVLGGMLLADTRITNGTLEYEKLPADSPNSQYTLNTNTIQLSGRYMKSINGAIGWQVFGEQSYLSNNENAKDGIPTRKHAQKIGYSGGGLVSGYTLGELKISNQVGITSEWGQNGRTERGINRNGYYVSGSMDFGKTKATAGLSNSSEGKISTIQVIHSMDSSRLSIDAKHTKQNSTILPSTIDLTAQLEYDIHKKARGWIKANYNTLYGKSQSGVQAGLGIKF